MPGDNTQENNLINEETQNNEGNNTPTVHYHLSANVKFDKENAFNGGETKIDGSWVNSNLEKKYFEESFNVTINGSGNKYYINKNKNKDTIEKLLGYDCIKINENYYKLNKFNDNYNNENIEILKEEVEIFTGEEIEKLTNDKTLQKEFTFSLQSIDNKGNVDKTKAGITYNIFAKNQENNDPKIQQFYHGGSGRKLKNGTKEAYDQKLIKEKQSFTLFYTRENIRDLNNENSILIGLGEIQNKIGVLDTSDRIKGSKIYCYNHYEVNNTQTNYHLFRFPYQELIAIKESNKSAKQFLEELIEPLSIENSDKPFFSYEQSKLIPTALVLKYANRLYEQIMKLKQNKNLWTAVQKASKKEDSSDENKWHFCDDISIGFLKDSRKKLREAQLNQKNPGLWALKEYFQINSGNEYDNFLKMCEGEENLSNDLVLFNSPKNNFNTLKNFILENLIKYPISNKKTFQRIFTHLGLKAVYRKKTWDQKISTDLEKLIINGKTIQNLLDRVNENKKIESDGKPWDRGKEINYYLYKNGFCEIEKFNEDKNKSGEITLDVELKYKIQIDRATNIQEIVSLEELKTNPYLLFEKYIQSDDAPLLLDDIDWGQKIISKQTNIEFNKYNPYRLRAIVVEYIKMQENKTGHVWVSYEDAQEYLNDRLFELDGELENFIKISDLIEKDEFKDVFEIKDKFLTLKEFAKREKFIHDKIKELMEKSLKKSADFLKKERETKDTNLQNKFIESELSLLKMQELDFVFISGVAGSGKSHTLCKYLDYLCQKNITDFQVLTPSGKAANVIKNKIKNDQQNFSNAKTLDLEQKIITADRYIVDSKEFWDYRLFARVDDGSETREDKKSEEIEVLIIDEISMITLDTLYYILKIKKPNKLIVLGDIKQLPPIGYGSLATSIYNHLFIDSSFQDICLAKMETSHRADDNSLFIKHSLTLRDKDKQLKEEDLKNSNENFILIPYSNESNKTIDEIIKEIYKMEGNKANFEDNIKEKNKEIQILTPNRIGESGTGAINNIFKDALDKDKNTKNVGLKFIYNKNDKETSLSNGTMGYISAENNTIYFDEEPIVFNENNLNSEYDYGFAITVHKSQGSGFPIVILVLPEKNNSLITKELIYTALTRPEKKMYILYHKDNIKALTHLPSIPHRNMNLFNRDKQFWIKDEIEYPIKYGEVEYRRKQDLYFALMLEYAGIKSTYHKNGAFVWEEEVEKLLMPKFYIKEKQDEKSFKYLKSIDLQKVYENFKFKLGSVVYEDLPKRNNENKEDIIEDNKELIEITTHNGLKTRSWSEAILMLIFDNLEIPYFYEVEIRREGDANTYKLTYPKPKNKDYRIPDFTISSEKELKFPEKGKGGEVEIKNVLCIIEHLGMLSNDSYKKGWKEKVKDYYEKYDFDIIAPLSSLTEDDSGTYSVSKIWKIEGDEIKVVDSTEEDIKKLNLDNPKVCFTTDEKDTKKLNPEDEKDLENIPTLIKKLELLKMFYSLN